MTKPAAILMTLAIILILTTATVGFWHLYEQVKPTFNWTEEEVRGYTYWVYSPVEETNYFTDNITYDQYGNLVLTKYVVYSDLAPKTLYRTSEEIIISQGLYKIRRQK